MIRKLFSFLFAGLILFNLCGYFFVFQCEQLRVKNEMKGLIRNGFFRNEYEEITISDPAGNRDLTILDKNEIRYRGKLYDIVSSKVSGNSVTYICINDTKEEKLVAQCHNYITWSAGLNSPGKSRTSQAMAYHIIKHAFPPHHSLIPTADSFRNVEWIDPTAKLNSISLKPFSPPPEII
ncbi:MAG: hypothetical protein NTU98_06485 [Bacteroidetes bacterium]|nr:hypothetical protein [Bacteroidota bacterium]